MSFLKNSLIFSLSTLMITSSVSDCYGIKRRRKSEKGANRVGQKKSPSELEIQLAQDRPNICLKGKKDLQEFVSLIPTIKNANLISIEIDKDVFLCEETLLKRFVVELKSNEKIDLAKMTFNGDGKTSISKGLIDVLQAKSTVTCLEFREYNITLDDLFKLSEALKNNKMVSELNFLKCNLDDETMPVLAEIVRNLNTLEECLNEARGLFKDDDIDNMNLSVKLLKLIASKAKSKIIELESLLSKAENFMKEKVKPVKVKSSSSPKVEEKVEKVAESVSDIESLQIVFYDKTAKDQYDFIDPQTKRDFKDDLSRYIKGESAKNFTPLPNRSFHEYRTARKGRIFFKLDEDFHNNHTIIILGATDTHDNNMIDKIDLKLKKGKK